MRDSKGAYRLGTSRKAFAVAVVALVIAASAVPFIVDQTGGDYVDDSTSVVYHSYYSKPVLGNGIYVTSVSGTKVTQSYVEYNTDNASDGDSERTQEMKYYGTVWSTEYNPQLWTSTPGDTAKNITQNWYDIQKYSSGAVKIGNSNYEAGRTLVFTGWKAAVYENGSLTGVSDVTYYPGEVIPKTVQDKATHDGKIHIYATWGYLNYTDAENAHRYYMNGNTNIYWFVDANGNSYYKADSTESSIYTNIVSSIRSYISAGNCTIDPTIKSGASTTYSLGNNSVTMQGDLIIQNATIKGSFGGNHGEDFKGGLFANGHVLILGLGMTGGNTSNIKEHLQVFGGNNGGTINNGISRYTYGNETNSLATMVIIHSGAYSNVISGSLSGTINGSTYLSVRGATVLDTVTGGCSGNNGNGAISGSAFVYATNMNMPGDTYEEKKLGTNMSNFNGISASNVSSTESTILTGASVSGTISGDTHVYISGTTAVWDVQGAGRGGKSFVTGTANLDISGKSVVKHAACGSITDGVREYISTPCVNKVNISVHDQARVAGLFGAGYDTFYKASYASMFGSDSSIDLTIDGGTVGYVYGGGYRGTVGTTGTGDNQKVSPLDHVTVNMSGGTILGDVFLGGRGGLDKICHNTDGTYQWGDSHNDTTGYSLIYAKSVNLNMTGGTVEGNVYGGGESVPVISKYDNSSAFGGKTLGGSNSFKDGTGVASVVADSLNINIENATIKGNFFGAGKGVDTAAIDSSNRHESAYTFAITDSGNIIKIPWLSYGSAGTTVEGTVAAGTYENYASVIVKTMSVTINNSTINNGNVYGGGALGKLTVSGEYVLNVTNTTMNGSVFGGGKGSSLNSSIASVSTNSMALKLSCTGMMHFIGDSVYGGGELSKSNSNGTVSVIVDNYEIRGSVYGGGKGTDVIGNEDWALLKANSVELKVSNSKVYSSVYGGGALGKISCSTVNLSVTGDSVIENSVYGGGKGSESNINSAQTTASDSVNVTIDGSSVLKSVYGGGQMSLVNAKSVGVSLINSAGVGGSVYGGGQGLSGKSEWALLKANTVGVSVEGSVVWGSVYGGGSLSRTEGSILITINNSTVKGVVFGGGLGSSGVVSTVGSRTVKISRSTIESSVLGSSSLGDDKDGDSTILLNDNVSVGASVYGGGFKGTLTGNTNITIRDNVNVRFSVYGGADIGDVTGDTFDDTLVIGYSTIEISGQNVSIGRSVFGSGNSCKVDDGKATTQNTITITGLGSSKTVSMESIQSADVVGITSSNLILTGRADASMSQASTKFSLNHIGCLNLHEKTTLDLRASVGDLGEYGSYLDASTESTVENPSNTIVLNDGMTFSVMKDNGVYGLVKGYTILSKNSTTYGAYAYGSKNTSENSGFSVHSDGVYVKLEPSIFEEQNCKCWFLKGTLTYDITAVAKYGSNSTTVTSVIPVSYTSMIDTEKSSIIFVGATPVVLRNGAMELVEGDYDGKGFGGTLSDSSKFGLIVGTNLSGNMSPTMTFGNEKGINALHSPTSTEDYANYIGKRNGMPVVSFTLFYNPEQEYTGYVGYVILHFIEASKTEDGSYSKFNEINVRLAIHTEGDTSSFKNMGDYSVNIVLDHGSGKQTFSIPRSFKDYTLWYAGSEVTDRYTFDMLSYQTVSNEGNTFGWNNPMGSPNLISLLPNDSAIDSLKGSHAAAIEFSLDNCTAQSSAVAKLNFILKPDTKGASIQFSIIVSVTPVKAHNVTFHQDTDIPVIISVNDGSTIHSTLIPSTGKYFVGWYTDEAHTKRYDFNTPVTVDLDLYADYKFTITFVHGDGTVSTQYIEKNTVQGSTVYKPEDPVRFGYTFAGWADKSGKVCFEKNHETVYDDTEYTAVWTGTAVKVDFGFSNSLSEEQINSLVATGFKKELMFDFGHTYAEGYYTDSNGKIVNVGLEENTAKLKKYLNENNLGKFIRWGLYDTDGNFLNAYVYSDMQIQSTSDHRLIAQIDNTALLMDLNGNKPSGLSDTYPNPAINAPIKSLLYGKDGSFVLSPSSGSLKGFTLSGWTYETASGSVTIPNGSSVTLTLKDGIVSDSSNRKVVFTQVTDEDSEFYGALRIEMKAVWEQIDYTLSIEEPLGNAKIVVDKVVNHKGDVIDFNASKLHYGDKVTLRYDSNGAQYSFSEWVCGGDCYIESSEGETAVLVITGPCSVSVRQGGMYGVNILLKIDGVLTTDYNLVLKDGNDSYTLKVVKNMYTHTLIPIGTYDLILDYEGKSYVISLIEVHSDTPDIEIELFTISIKSVNDSSKVSCPTVIAKKGTSVRIDVEKGYEITESNVSLIDNCFEVVSKTELDLTVDLIRYTISVNDRSDYGSFELSAGNGVISPVLENGVLKYTVDYGSGVSIKFESKEWTIFKWMVNGAEYKSGVNEISFDVYENKDIVTIMKSYGSSVDRADLGTREITERNGTYDSEGKYVYSILEIKKSEVYSISDINIGSISFRLTEKDSCNVIEVVSNGPLSGTLQVVLYCNDGSATITLNLVFIAPPAPAGDVIFPY